MPLRRHGSIVVVVRIGMTRTRLAVLAALALAGTVVAGHHVNTDFYLDREATIAGVVEGIRFQNPHVLIVVRTADAGRFTAEWHGAGWLQSHPELVSPMTSGPVTAETLKFGDHIVLVGAPARDAALRSLVNVKEIRRPRDGWLWSCRRADAPRACGRM